MFSFKYLSKTILCQSSSEIRYVCQTIFLKKHSGIAQFIFLASSRKLAESLEPKRSNGGRLETAPSQPKKSPTTQSFIREAAPHTTRVPVHLWNKPSRRLVERPARSSSDKRLGSERIFHDSGGGKGGVSERYGQARTFRGRQAREEVAESIDKRYRVTESHRQYLERRDARESGKPSVSRYTKKNPTKY